LESLGERSCQLHDISRLTVLTACCSEFNFELHGKDKILIHLLRRFLNIFKSKLQFLNSQLGKGILTKFPNLYKGVEKYDGSTCTFDTFCTDVQNLWKELMWRFQDSKQLEPVLSFRLFPFAQVDMEDISATISSCFQYESFIFGEINIETPVCYIPGSLRWGSTCQPSGV
jgi:hypothetical protein